MFFDAIVSAPIRLRYLGHFSQLVPEEDGPKLPDHLVGLFPNPRGHKYKHDAQRLLELHKFIALHEPQFVVGDPADWDNPRYFVG